MELDQVEEIVDRWLLRTVEVLNIEIDRLDVKDTEDLKESLGSRLTRISSGILGAEISFLIRGRFVDMGAGRKRAVDAFSEREVSNKRKQKQRKPKKWYLPAFYGRINDLEGVLGFQVMEQALMEIKQGINGTQDG